MRDLRFTKRLRLLRPNDFQRVFDSRCAVADDNVRVFGAANMLGHARLGLAVSRKVGNSVARNRWKRAIREAFRLAQHDLPPIDLVCIPVRSAAPNVQQLIIALPKLAERIAKKLAQRAT